MQTIIGKHLSGNNNVILKYLNNSNKSQKEEKWKTEDTSWKQNKTKW